MEILISIFALVIKVESELEKSRQELSFREEFSPELLFEYLDFKSKGKIMFSRFFEFLQDDLAIKDLDINLAEELFSFYDINGKDYLNLDDLSRLLEPRKQTESDDLAAGETIQKEREIQSFSKVRLYTQSVILTMNLDIP